MDDKVSEGKSNHCQMVCPGKLPPRGIYVKIEDQRSVYVARIIDGPFYVESGESPHYILELTSMLSDGKKCAVTNRPQPNGKVSFLDPVITQEYVGTTGDLKLGKLLGQPNVEVCLDSATLSRHIGIFGTTGSGKSNSLQVIAEESSAAGRAILIFDIEGEYVRMNFPTEELVSTLHDFGVEPAGVEDFSVFVPASNTSLNPDAKKFGIPFRELDLEIFADVLGLNPFERVYLFEVARKAKNISGSLQAYDLTNVLNVLKKRIEGQVDKASIPEMVAEAHMGLYAKLSLAQSVGVIDAPFEKPTASDFCKQGRISVIDMSEASDLLRNICVAHFLRETFRYKTRNPQSTPLTLFVEEIHTFISKGKSRKMLATITMLTEMARQGRKRGLSLGIVSQQPALLPSELIELCNTRVVHKLGSTPNLQALRQSTGNVPDSLWSMLSSLGKGEVLIASPKYEHAVLALVRPNRTKRLRVEFG